MLRRLSYSGFQESLTSVSPLISNHFFNSVRHSGTASGKKDQEISSQNLQSIPAVGSSRYKQMLANLPKTKPEELVSYACLDMVSPNLQRPSYRNANTLFSSVPQPTADPQGFALYSQKEIEYLLHEAKESSDRQRNADEFIEHSKHLVNPKQSLEEQKGLSFRTSFGPTPIFLTQAQEQCIDAVLDGIRYKYGIRKLTIDDSWTTIAAITYPEKWVRDKIEKEGASVSSALIAVVELMVPTLPELETLEDLAKSVSYEQPKLLARPTALSPLEEAILDFELGSEAYKPYSKA